MTDRVTLITGASAGIGAELARVFASKGHRLALVDPRARSRRQTYSSSRSLHRVACIVADFGSIAEPANYS
jgi:short-subunit dehydrogenase